MSEALKMGTLGEELRRIFPASPKIAKYVAPPRPPNATDVSVEGLYISYETQCENIKVKDARNEFICYKPENFPYLIKLEFWNTKTKTWVDAIAGIVMTQLKEKTFDARRYRVGDYSRARTLFWISDILKSPDCIHENDNAGMHDKDIYVMRYQIGDPNDAEIKVVLTGQRTEGKVVASSFWTDQDWLRRSVRMPPLYVRPNSKGCRCR